MIVFLLGTSRASLSLGDSGELAIEDIVVPNHQLRYLVKT